MGLGIERRGRLRAAVQEDGVSLLRLGRQLQGRKVRILLPFQPCRLPALVHPQELTVALPSSFIEKTLPKFAAKHPEIEISVSPRPQKHPVVIAHYINGQTRPVCLKKLDPNQILAKLDLLRDSTGHVNRRVNKPVISTNSSVRGVWSPYHGDLKTV